MNKVGLYLIGACVLIAFKNHQAESEPLTKEVLSARYPGLDSRVIELRVATQNAFHALYKFDRKAAYPFMGFLLKFDRILRDHTSLKLIKLRLTALMDDAIKPSRGFDLSKANEKIKTTLQLLLDAKEKVKNIKI
uniref:Uncharacterized protein n=1 Tax=Strigamia maritima TaxID=126957 RepID=T1J8K2_STRMM